MADHILTSTKKCIPDSSGKFFSSGGPGQTAYGNFEKDYFIIRRTAAEFAALPLVIFTPTLWNVYDESVSSTEYDFIDVFTSATGWPNSWTWQTRLGGVVYNQGAGMASTNLYYLTGQHIKFCFSSKGRSDGSRKGWQVDWRPAAVAGTAVLWSTGESTAHYSDITDIKENCGDDILDRARGTFGNNLFNFDYFTEQDPGNEGWEYLPQGQLMSASAYANDSRGITVIPWNIAQTNFTPLGPAGVGLGMQVPFSYMATDRRKVSSLGEITIGRSGDEST